MLMYVRQQNCYYKATSKPELTRDTGQLKNSKNSETLYIGKIVHP